jgi:hypothetical protein
VVEHALDKRVVGRFESVPGPSSRQRVYASNATRKAATRVHTAGSGLD